MLTDFQNYFTTEKGIKFPTTTTLHTFNGPFSGTTRVSRYQKGKTNLDFTEARDSEWQWHQQICKSASRSRQDNHASTPPQEERRQKTTKSKKHSKKRQPITAKSVQKRQKQKA